MEKEGNNSQNKDITFILYVSNQSSDIKLVDIKIFIDGQKVIDNDFDFGEIFPAHQWKTFEFSISKGVHKLKVESTKGETQLEKEFEISDKHWGFVAYWYKKEGNLTRKNFAFEIQDKPIYFE